VARQTFVALLRAAVAAGVAPPAQLVAGKARLVAPPLHRLFPAVAAGLHLAPNTKPVIWPGGTVELCGCAKDLNAATLQLERFA